MSKRTTSIKWFLSLSSMFSIGIAVFSPIWKATHKANISYTLTHNGTKIENRATTSQSTADGPTSDQMKLINEKMNSTVVNKITATSIDTLDTTGVLVKTNPVSGQPITYYNPYTICDYVQLNTYNLPKAAQITYVVGLTSEDIQDRVILGTNEAFKNSICGKYSSYSGITGDPNTVLNVAAYSNMIYNDGILQCGENYLLSTVKFVAPNNRPDPLPPSSTGPKNFSWTFGLMTNTVESGSKNISSVVNMPDPDHPNAPLYYYQDLDYFNSRFKDVYIVPLVASQSGAGVQIFRFEISTQDIKNPDNYSYKNQWLGTLSAANNPEFNMTNIPLPGLNYLNPVINAVDSIRYEISKEDMFPSEYNNVTIGQLVNFSSQGFNRGDITYNRKYYNDLVGKTTIEIVGTAAQLGVSDEKGNDVQTKLPYVYTINLDGLKCWMPIIVAIISGTLAIIFFVISMILLNKTSENKKYKLVRRTL